MSPDQFSLSEEFQKLQYLYSNVKEKILLAEEINDNLPLACINEMRNALDHLLRGDNNNPNKIKGEFDSAFRHIKRAGYDACEIICTGLIEKIESRLESYSLNTLNEVYKEYYTSIKPDLEDVKYKYLISARHSKSHDITEDNKENHYKAFDELTKRINGYLIDVTKKVPVLEDYEN